MKRIDWEAAKRRAAGSLARAEAVLEQRRTLPASMLKLHGGDCPKCGKATVRRFRKRDNSPFYSCIGYPKCDGIWKPPRA